MRRRLSDALGLWVLPGKPGAQEALESRRPPRVCGNDVRPWNQRHRLRGLSIQLRAIRRFWPDASLLTVPPQPRVQERARGD